jgi:hypothetical protein
MVAPGFRDLRVQWNQNGTTGGRGPVRLTDTGIRALKPKSETYAVYDDELRGFGVRVSAAGTKSFTFVYRLNGRKTRLNLGKFPFVNLAQARADAHKALGAVKGERKDPRTVREESNLRKAGGLTISGLTDLYLASDKFKSGRDATRDQFSRIIAGEIAPALRRSDRDRSPRSLPPTSWIGARESSIAARRSPRTSPSRSCGSSGTGAGNDSCDRTSHRFRSPASASRGTASARGSATSHPRSSGDSSRPWTRSRG